MLIEGSQVNGDKRLLREASSASVSGAEVCPFQFGYRLWVRPARISLNRSAGLEQSCA